MIELANETGAEPWFTIPHLATDATVAAMARQIRDELAPGRTIYIEHSNEIWNNFQTSMAGLGVILAGIPVYLWFVRSKAKRVRPS